MLTEGPQTQASLMDNDATPPHSPQKQSFSLSAHPYMQSPTHINYTMVTRMPSKETLQELDQLPEKLKRDILNCIEHIYSPVTQRKAPENTEHFFVHVGATAIFEIAQNTKIKDKDHVKKAASLLGMIDNVLDTFEKYRFPPEKEAILKTFDDILNENRNLLIKALQSASSELKEHLKQYMRLDVDQLQLVTVDDESKKELKKKFPLSPVHVEPIGRITPKSKSDEDKKSIEYLQRLKKPINRVLFHPEEEDNAVNKAPPLKMFRFSNHFLLERMTLI